MATTVDELQVLITANTEQLQKEIDKTQSGITNLAKKVNKSTGNLTASFIKAGIFTKTLGLAMKTLTANLGSAISRLDTLNNYTNVMSNLGISSEDAEASIQRLSDKLQGLPTTLDDAVSSVQRFTSANGNIKASTDMFLALNNAILSGGASTETQASALEQLSQAYSKGKPDMMEWRTAMTAMPAQLKQVALAMGYVSADQLGEALRNGKVSMNDFMLTLMKLNKEGANGFQSFEQQALNSTGGVKTSMTNVKTAITRGLTEIMNAIGQSNIAGFFQNIAKAINSVIPYITGFVKACVWAVNSITSLFGGGKTKKNVDNVAKSMSNLGGSGTSTSKGLDNATGSAKKLNKELGKLAGFDEMNVLTENSDTGGGSGDNTGGGADFSGLGDLDFSDWDTGLNNTSSKADEVAEQIIGAFKKIGDYINTFDFTGIVGHILSIKDSVVGIFTDSNIINAGQNWVKTLIDSLSSITSNVIQIGINIADGLLGSIDKYLQQNSNRIKNCIVNLFNISGRNLNITDNLFQALTEISEIFRGDVAEQIGADIIGMFANPFMSLGETFLQFSTDMYDLLVTPITDNIELIKLAFENTLEPISVVFSTFNDMFTTFGDSIAGIYDKHLAPFFESLKKGLSDSFSKFLDVYNQYIVPFIQNCADRFSDIWNNHLKPLWDNISEFIGNIIDGIKLLWETWIKPLIDWIIQNIIPIIVPILSQIANKVSSAIKIIIDVINVVLGVLNGVITFIKGVFTGNWQQAWSGIQKIFSSIFNGIKNIISTVINFIKDTIINTVQSIYARITAILTAIKTTISLVLGGILNGIKNIINCIIGALNSLINGINKLSFDVPDWVPGIGGKKWGFNIPNIPKLARGGIVDKPTIAQIGEAGKEAIVPLENNTAGLNMLADKLADKIGNSGTPVQLVVKLGEDTIFDKFIENIKEKNFETNGEVFV